MTAAELDRLMVAQWGPDYRRKALVGPLGVFPLASVFDECGLRDPRERLAPEPRGLWQALPIGRLSR